MSNKGSTSSDQLLAAVQHRRTYYGIKNESTISDDKIQRCVLQLTCLSKVADKGRMLKLSRHFYSIVYESVKHVPMAFNIQTSSAIFFKHDAHVKVGHPC